MRVTLLFPPPASATYVPLGLASLAAHLRARLPSCELRLLDLNLHAWNLLAERSREGIELRAFMRGERQGFLDGAHYAGQQQRWAELGRELERIREQARRYAGREVSDPEPELRGLLDEQVRLVLATDPDVLGISTLYPDQVVFGAALARAVRGLAPERPRIIVGGAALTALRPDELMRCCPELDALLLGEGEPGAALWIGGAPPDEVPGLLHRDGSELRLVRRSSGAPLEELPPPDFSGLELTSYFNPRPVLPALMSRGCPWRRCRFCAHNASLGRHRRKRAASLVAELQLAQERYGARHFYLADQYLDATALDELARAILEVGLRVSFHVMGRPTVDYTPELLARAAAAGCRWISWGVESGSQRLLDLVRKGTRAQDIPRVLRAASAAGISNLAMLIFGLPTSTDADLEATLALLEQIYEDLDALTASTFVLFDGTPFGRRPERYGLARLEAQPLIAGVASLRRTHRELGSDGAVRPPRASLEIAAWDRRRRWLGELRFDRLCTEHYLLHASARA